MIVIVIGKDSIHRVTEPDSDTDSDRGDGAGLCNDSKYRSTGSHISTALIHPKP